MHRLVELIVLNVGLQVGIIDARLFSMFVVEAVVLTFATTPMTLWIYPERVRTRGTAELDHKKSATDAEKSATGSRFMAGASGGREHTSKFLVVLQKIEHLAAVMLLAQMLEPPPATQRSPWSAKDKEKSKKNLDGDISEGSVESHPNYAPVPLEPLKTGPAAPLIRINALKLIELTGRTFSVMQSAEKDQLLLTDDALQLFRQFGRLRGLEITPHITIVGQDSFPAAVAEYAGGLGSELVIVPWTVPVSSSSSSALTESPSVLIEKGGVTPSPSSISPFDGIFTSETQGSPLYTHFIRHVFSESPSDVALLIDRGFGSSASYSPGAGQHIFMPFFGGADDRLALRFVVQLCHHTNVTASIVWVQKSGIDGESAESEKVEMSEPMRVHQNALLSNQLTVGGSKSVSRFFKPPSESNLQVKDVFGDCESSSFGDC